METRGRKIKYEVPPMVRVKKGMPRKQLGCCCSPREFSPQFKMHVIGNFYWATLSMPTTPVESVIIDDDVVQLLKYLPIEWGHLGPK